MKKLVLLGLMVSSFVFAQEPVQIQSGVHTATGLHELNALTAMQDHFNQTITNLVVTKNPSVGRVYFNFDIDWSHPCMSCRLLVRYFDKNGHYINSKFTPPLIEMKAFRESPRGFTHRTVWFSVNERDLPYIQSAELGFYVEEH